MKKIAFKETILLIALISTCFFISYKQIITNKNLIKTYFKSPKLIFNQSSYNFDLIKVPLIPSKGDSDKLIEIGNATKIDEFIFYSEDTFNKMDIASLESKIIKFNTLNNQKEILYKNTHDDFSNGISCIESLQNKIFWVEESSDWEIKELDLKTLKTSVIKSKPPNSNEFPPHLSVVGNYLIWYKINEEGVFIESYNPINNDLVLLDFKNIYLPTPYAKVPNSNNHILFLSKENNTLSINQYNIENKTNKKVKTNFKNVCYFNSSDEYIILTTDWIDSDVFLYSFKEDTMNTLFDLSSSESFRSAIFVKDKIILDLSNFKLPNKNKINSNIIEVDFKNKTFSSLYSSDNDSFAWLQKDNINSFFIDAICETKKYIYLFSFK